MNTNETFKVGIYLRLSRDDEREDESQSISNQRDYIMNYIIRNNLMLIDEYVDDGVSGTQFDRDGFERLISDIENVLNQLNNLLLRKTSYTEIMFEVEQDKINDYSELLLIEIDNNNNIVDVDLNC